MQFEVSLFFKFGNIEINGDAEFQWFVAC